MNTKQREKIEVAVEVIINGYSKKNQYMGYTDAYDILKDYINIYENRNNTQAKRKALVQIDETEDTATIMFIIKTLINSCEVKNEIHLFNKEKKELKESED